MDELRLLCLVAFCIHVVQSQPQEDVNTLLRQRQGFPAAVQRSFFNPVNDPRQSDQGVFTIDRHLEVPQSSVARGHSRFEMQGSRQGKTEAFRIGQFSAAGVHPGMNGVMDHGGPSAVAQGQMEASKEAQLGASGQTEVTIEGEASVPTRRIGQFSAAGVHPGMTGVMDHGGPSGEAQGQMEASREAQLGASGQTEVTVEGEASVPTRRIGQFSAAGIHPGMTGATTGVAQGQMEASREAQLGASGQTEVTVEGEALVPTRLLTGRRSGGVTGGDQMGLASSGQGRFGSMGQAATVDNVNRRLNQGQLEASSQAELAAGGQGEITVEGEVAVPTQVLDAAQRVRGGIVGGVGAGVGGTQTGEISGARAADVSVSQGGAISGSATGGQLGRTLKGQGVIGQRDIGSGGSLEITNQADVKAGGQGEVSIEGEIAVPTQMLNRAGGSFTQGSGGLHGTRGLSGTTGEQDVTRSQDSLGGRVLDFRGLGMSGNGQGQMSTSREGQLSSSRDARLSVGQSVGQLQTGGVREGQLSASNQVDMSAGGQGEVTIEGEIAVPKHLGSVQTGQLSANRDRDLRLGGSRDTTITGSRGGQIETSRKVGLGLSRDTQLDASRERQLMSGQTGQVSGTRDRDLRLGASRDTTITGPRGGQFETSRKVGLGLSRDTQLDASRRRDQSVGQLTTGGMREGQLTASNQVDMSAGGKGEVIVEGEIAVPRRFVGGARQIGSGQTGQISGSRDRDLRLGTSRDTTITGPRGGQFETSRKVGLGLSRDTQLDASRERQIGSGQTGQISGSRDRDLRVGASRDTSITGPRGRQIETSRKVGLGLSRDTQLDASRERQLMSGQTGQVSGTRDRDLRLGASRDTTITGPRGGQFETSRKVGLGLSRDTQLDASRRRDQSVGQLTTGGMREGQLTASNQVDMSAGGKGEVIVEGEIAVPRRFVGGARQVFDRGSRQDRVGFQRDRRLDLSGSRQTDISGQVSRQAGLSGQQTMGGLGGKHIDLTHLAGQVDQGISGSVDLTGQRERNLNRVGSGPSDRFPGLGQGTGRINMGQRMENSDRFPIKHVSVNVRCYADPVKGLSCGIEYPDNQCREKWDFPNPCTRENMDMKITKFVHPYDNSKFLMCGEMGKLYIVQCPRLEIFHAGCGQCVDENVGLTASCEEPLSPQTSNPCTRKNIIDNKLFFGYPRNISKYIHCDVWGKPWVRECTRGEVWDQWQVSCVNPSLINPCSRPNADLAFLYPHPCDPKRYLRCDLQGDAYEEVCDYKEAFNVATQYCDPVGSFYGSDDPPYCADYVFGFQHIRTFNDPRLRQGGNGGSSQTGTGFGQASTRNRGPERTDLGQGINGKPVSPKDGVTNLAGTITIHRSKLRTYIYRKGEQYVQPCITDNIKEGRYHFRVTGDPHSFIQCDDHGFAHLISCPPGDYFDPWTNTCVDGAVHVDNLISK